MARNASGTNTLPATNPVAAGTVITTSWANPTMSDISDEITNSLSRNGNGGMLAGLSGFAGTNSLPGYAFTDEIATGLYRAGAADIRFSVGTLDATQWVDDSGTPAGSQQPLKIWDGAAWKGALYAGGPGVGDALTANPLSQFAATTSAQLAGVISDETGTGVVVFSTSPTLITPALGTPASGVATNLTGTAAGLTAGNATNAATAATSNALKSATTTVNVSSATAPAAGQLLTATSATAATWQTPDDGVGNQVAQVSTGNGFGSTNTTCRRFTTTVSAVGSDITYADSAANGATFTINTAGLYEIVYFDTYNFAGGEACITKNSAALTSPPSGQTAANVLAWGPSGFASVPAFVSVVASLAASDVIRAQTPTYVNGSTALNSGFSIRRVGTV